MNPLRLGSDPDLAAIRSLPDFQAVVAECERRSGQRQREVMPEVRVGPPEGRGRWGQPPPLLVVLHPCGGDVEGTLEHWRSACRSGALLAAAQGTVLEGPHEYAWGSDAEVEMAAHLESLTRERSFDPDRAMLAGVSQGAGIAVGLALRRMPVASRGFIAVAGVPPAEASDAAFPTPLAAAAAADVRGVFITGEDDFARERIVETYTMLRDLDVDVRLELVPELGHGYPGDFADRLEAALEYVFG